MRNMAQTRALTFTLTLAFSTPQQPKHTGPPCARHHPIHLQYAILALIRLEE